MELMTIGRVAASTGLSPKAIRLYERRGLLPAAERTEAGYRLFTAADLDVLHFIRQAKTLDLTLEEIKDVLDLQRGGEQPCDRVTTMLDAHLHDIDLKLSDLRRLRDSLIAARRAAGTARRGGHEVMVCRIIENAPSAAPAEKTRP
ncbi:MAG: heavy metal-responsive transcriptional regulator [Pseudonocardiaceae bacterium]